LIDRLTVLVVGWGTAFLQQHIWGNGVTPRSLRYTTWCKP